MLRNKLVMFFLLSLPFLITLDLYYARLDHLAIVQTKTIGNEIIQKINAYKQSTGSYPETLDIIYNPKTKPIPLPTWGVRKWYYNPHRHTGIKLSVKETLDGNALYYNFSSGRWRLSSESW